MRQTKNVRKTHEEVGIVINKPLDVSSYKLLTEGLSGQREDLVILNYIKIAGSPLV